MRICERKKQLPEEIFSTLDEILFLLFCLLMISIVDGYSQKKATESENNVRDVNNKRGEREKKFRMKI